MKGIDAVTREQLVQIMAVLGVGDVAPIFSMVPGPFKPAALLPSITEEDKIILSNVQKIVEFLTAGSSISRSPDQVSILLLTFPTYTDVNFIVFNMVLPAHLVAWA